MNLLVATTTAVRSFDIWTKTLPQEPARAFAGYRCPPCDETCTSDMRSTRAEAPEDKEAAFDRVALDRWNDDGGPARDD